MSVRGWLISLCVAFGLGFGLSFWLYSKPDVEQRIMTSFQQDEINTMLRDGWTVKSEKVCPPSKNQASLVYYVLERARRTAEAKPAGETY